MSVVMQKHDFSRILKYAFYQFGSLLNLNVITINYIQKRPEKSGLRYFFEINFLQQGM